MSKYLAEAQGMEFLNRKQQQLHKEERVQQQQQLQHAQHQQRVKHQEQLAENEKQYLQLSRQHHEEEHQRRKHRQQMHEQEEIGIKQMQHSPVQRSCTVTSTTYTRSPTMNEQSLTAPENTYLDAQQANAAADRYWTALKGCGSSSSQTVADAVDILTCIQRHGNAVSETKFEHANADVSEELQRQNHAPMLFEVPPPNNNSDSSAALVSVPSAGSKNSSTTTLYETTAAKQAICSSRSSSAEDRDTPIDAEYFTSSTGSTSSAAIAQHSRISSEKQKETASLAALSSEERENDDSMTIAVAAAEDRECQQLKRSSNDRISSHSLKVTNDHANNPAAADSLISDNKSSDCSSRCVHSEEIAAVKEIERVSRSISNCCTVENGMNRCAAASKNHRHECGGSVASGVAAGTATSFNSGSPAEFAATISQMGSAALSNAAEETVHLFVSGEENDAAATASSVHASTCTSASTSSPRLVHASSSNSSSSINSGSIAPSSTNFLFDTSVGTQRLAFCDKAAVADKIHSRENTCMESIFRQERESSTDNSSSNSTFHDNCLDGENCSASKCSAAFLKTTANIPVSPSVALGRCSTSNCCRKAPTAGFCGASVENSTLAAPDMVAAASSNTAVALADTGNRVAAEGDDSTSKMNYDSYSLYAACFQWYYHLMKRARERTAAQQAAAKTAAAAEEEQRQQQEFPDSKRVLVERWLQRPARQQVDQSERQKYSHTEGVTEYNIWYHKYLTDRYNRPSYLDRETAPYKCDPERDAGYTLADIHEHVVSPFQNVLSAANSVASTTSQSTRSEDSITVAGSTFPAAARAFQAEVAAVPVSAVCSVPNAAAAETAHLSNTAPAAALVQLGDTAAVNSSVSAFTECATESAATVSCVPGTADSAALRLHKKKRFWKHLPRRRESYFCVYFAQGMCALGSKCQYRHALPTCADEGYFEWGKDVFGRERFKAHKDEMDGIGSFLHEGKTLFISGFRVLTDEPDALLKAEEFIRQEFSTWGDITSVRMIPKKHFAFISYAYRLQAEFAKTAMNDQSLGPRAPIITVRWAHQQHDTREKRKMTFADPKPVDKRPKIKQKPQIGPTLRTDAFNAAAVLSAISENTAAAAARLHAVCENAGAAAAVETLPYRSVQGPSAIAALACTPQENFAAPSVFFAAAYTNAAAGGQNSAADAFDGELAAAAPESSALAVSGKTVVAANAAVSEYWRGVSGSRIEEYAVQTDCQQQQADKGQSQANECVSWNMLPVTGTDFDEMLLRANASQLCVAGELTAFYAQRERAMQASAGAAAIPSLVQQTGDAAAAIVPVTFETGVSGGASSSNSFAAACDPVVLQQQQHDHQNAATGEAVRKMHAILTQVEGLEAHAFEVIV